MGTRLYIERNAKRVCLDWFGWEIGGIGLPQPLNRTSQSPLQNGSNFVGMVFEPRIVGLVINPAVCNEDDIQKIYDILSPAFLGEGDYTLTLLAGENLYKLRNVKYVSETRTDRYASLHRVRTYGYQFVAEDPIWYGSTESSVFGPTVLVDELSFPAEFPIEFETDEVLAVDNVVTVDGNWISWPTITMVGPMQNPTVRNQTLGEMFRLLYNLAAGEVVTATFDPTLGSTIENNAGDNLWGYLSEDTHLGRFYLVPSIYGGNTTLQARGSGCTPGVSTITVSWEPCYVGV